MQHSAGRMQLTDALAVAWRHCPPEHGLWMQVREPLLQLLQAPPLLLPLVGLLAWAAAAAMRWNPLQRWAVAVVVVALISGLYSPWCTVALSRWLEAHVPLAAPSTSGAPVAVLLGRGPLIAAATTTRAAALAHQQRLAAVYVSGDAISTAEALLQLGVTPQRIAGDSCARTTWENATLTARWLQQHHPTSPVLLITDPWQLARASVAFARHGVAVTPIAVEPPLSPRGRNQLALRETLATLLYRLQGRMG